MCLVEPDKGSGRKCRRKIDEEKIVEERLFSKAIGEGSTCPNLRMEVAQLVLRQTKGCVCYLWVF